MLVNEKNLPFLYRAFCIIETYNDTDAQHLSDYEVPDEAIVMCVAGNAGLALLTEDEFAEFATGGSGGGENILKIRNRTMNLKQADMALDKFANEWRHENSDDEAYECEDED